MESNSGGSELSVESKCKEELRFYQSRERLDEQKDPLLWWKRNQGCFPVLAVVARQVLAIPATSASAERLFSLAGHVLSKTRNSLGTDVV